MKKSKRMILLCLATLLIFNGMPNIVYASGKVPELTAYQKNNHVKLEWAVEMAEEDVLLRTSFEPSDTMKPSFPVTNAIHYQEGVSNVVSSNTSLISYKRYANGWVNKEYFEAGNGATSMTFTTGEKYTIYYYLKDGRYRLEQIIRTNGFQEITNKQAYTGSYSYKVGKTEGKLGNKFWFPALNSEIAYCSFATTYQIKNGMDLSISFRAKSTDKSIITPDMHGGMSSWTYPLSTTNPVIVTKKALAGESKIYARGLEYLNENGVYYVTNRQSRTEYRNHSYYRVLEINKAEGYFTIGGKLTDTWDVGYEVHTHTNRTPVSFGSRTITANDGWVLYNINTKVKDYEDYASHLLGLTPWLSVQSSGETYIDDVKLGFATKAQLYRGDELIYEGYLSDYEDISAIDKVAPNPVSNITLSNEKNTLFINFTKPEDKGTSYSYKIRGKSDNSTSSFSPTKTVNVVSGIKGYSYVIDKSPNTIPDNTVDVTTNKISMNVQTGGTYYLHIKAIDNQGNVSSVTHKQINIPKLSVATTPVTSNPELKWEMEDKTQTYAYDVFRELNNQVTKVATLGNVSSYVDTTAKDTAKPNKSQIRNVVVNGNAGEIKIDFDGATDTGTTYKYYIEATGNTDKLKSVSNIAETTVTSGIKGYSIVVDNNPNTIPDNQIETTSSPYILNTLKTSEFYVHVASVDNAGNVSDVTHYKYSDNEFPNLILTQNVSSMTNEDVVITVNASDNGSGIKEIILPDATAIKGNTATYKATKNGTYTFKAVDYFGNSTTKSIEISNIDKTVPTLSLTKDINAITNKDIIITVTAEDLGSGVREIVLPNGNKVSGSNATYMVFENGTYEFKAIDNVGNETTKSITISNIDKIEPIITINPYNTEWTNKDITVTATTNKGSLNKTSHTFTANGSFEFVVTDEAGNIAKKTVTIQNIDKVAPSMPKIYKEEDELILIESEDNLSGIKTYMYKLSDKDWISFNDNINVEDYIPGDYTIEIKSIDNAGNESSVYILDFTVENKKLNRALEILEKVKNDLRLVDYEMAYDLISDLVNHYVEQSEVDRLLTLLERLKPQVEENEKIINAQSKIDNLDDLTYLNLLEIESSIDKISDVRIKNELSIKLKNKINIVQEDKLFNLDNTIENLKQGNSLTAEDIETIYEEALKLQEGEARNKKIEEIRKAISGLTSKLVSNPAEKAVMNAIELAENLKSQKYIDNVKALVKDLEPSEFKSIIEARIYYLELTQLMSSDRYIKYALRYVEMAEALNREPHIQNAKDIVSQLSPSQDKANLLIRIEALTGPLSEAERLVIQASVYLECAEQYNYALIIRKAEEKINLLEDSEAKTALMERLNNLINNK